jgi:outer membrane protein assembly factor BamB
VLALVGVVSLGMLVSSVTGWNPVPSLLDVLNRVDSLSSPEAAWRARVPDQPIAATATAGGVVVVTHVGVEVLGSGSGDLVWHRDAAWAAVAGAPGAEVVVVGRPGRRGYDVVDPATGIVRWDDPAAQAAWTWRDRILTLRCGRGCVLAARDPGDGRTRWSVAVPAAVRVLSGGNPDLAAPRPMLAPGAQPVQRPPAPVPDLVGLPAGGQVVVVGTAGGTRLGTYPTGPRRRVVVTARRVLWTDQTDVPGGCRYAVTALDPVTGRTAWRRDGYALGAATPSECAQGRDPVGAGGVVAGTGPRGVRVLLDAASGRVVYTTRAGETMLTTDGSLLLVRGADRRTVRGLSVGSGGQRFRLDLGRGALAMLTPLGVVVTDPATNGLTVLDTGGTERFRASTGAGVLGTADDALVISRARTVGLLRVG